MKRYLLDANHVGRAVSRDSPVRSRITFELKKGARFGTCIPVLCEIEAGIQQVRDPAAYRENLQHLLRQVRIWPLTVETAANYGELYHQLRAKGRVLSAVDIMVAALAREMRLIVLTTDRDFEALPKIRTADWT